MRISSVTVTLVLSLLRDAPNNPSVRLLHCAGDWVHICFNIATSDSTPTKTHTHTQISTDRQSLSDRVHTKVHGGGRKALIIQYSVKVSLMSRGTCAAAASSPQHSHSPLTLLQRRHCSFSSLPPPLLPPPPHHPPLLLLLYLFPISTHSLHLHLPLTPLSQMCL